MASIGMQYVVWAPLTSEASNTLTYGTGRVLGKAVSANLSWQKEDNDLYADDAVAETDGSLTGYQLDLTLDELSATDEAAVLGLSKVGSTDEYEQTTDSPPYGGAGYVQVMVNGGTSLYKAAWYPKVMFTQNSETVNTKGKSITWGTPTINGKGVAAFNDASGKGKFRAIQRFTTLAAAKAYLNGKVGISSNG